MDRDIAVIIVAEITRDGSSGSCFCATTKDVLNALETILEDAFIPGGDRDAIGIEFKEMERREYLELPEWTGF